MTTVSLSQLLASFNFVGYAGSQGSLGFTGSTGTGFTGSQGAAGFAGSTGTGFTGSAGATGLGFAIARTYASVAALTADTTPAGILAGQFAVIETGDVNNAENSRLYLWNGTVYSYVTDLSGAVGITGPAGPAGNTGFAGSMGSNGFTGSAGALSNWIKRTANYTAVSGDRIIADTVAGSFTVVLPASPVLGSLIKITDGYNFAANSLTVGANGSTIESQSEDVIVDIGKVDLEFIYDGSTWQIISTMGPKGFAGSAGSAGVNGFTGSSGIIGFTGSAGGGGSDSAGNARVFGHSMIFGG